MPVNDNLLKQLRDIHLPSKVTIWPLAPGWYIFLSILLLILIIGAVWLYYKKHKRYAAYQHAIQKLIKLSTQQDTLFSNDIAAHVSILLRRVALAYYPRAQVAGLTGYSWLEFLDKTGNTQAFTQGVGKCLLSLPYQKPTNTDISDLIQLAKTWMEKQSIKISNS